MRISKKSPMQRLNKSLLEDLRQIIIQARHDVAKVVNNSLVTLYWSVGERIRKDILKEKRADYGEEIVYALSRQLISDFGPSFGKQNLFHMIRFSESFQNTTVVQELSRHLSWTHFRKLIYVKDPLKRDFYAEMCRIERWNTRTLEKKIGGMLFERTALSKKPSVLIKKEINELREEDKLTPDLVFRDPYFLDFLGLKDTYSEKDIGKAILREMEKFILELGVGFTFVAREKRITVDNEDFYIDLLFYHRKLKRLIAIELKLGEFKAADKGQMELYLRWLEKYEVEPEEKAPLGLILCAGKSTEQVELLQLEKSGIRIASYETRAVPSDLLKKRLHDAVIIARTHLQDTIEHTQNVNRRLTSKVKINDKILLKKRPKGKA